MTNPLDYFDLPKFANGGIVDSVPEEAIKNTVRDPQAARLLDLDLAKYALMNQPQRMAGGGAMKKITKAVTKPAALSQAQRDANLAKFLEESQFPRGYHGTTSLDEHSYEPAAITRFNDYKPVWAAENPSLAEEYVGHDSGATYPLHISAKNPLKLNADMNDRVGSSPEVQKMLDSFGIEYNKDDTIYRHVNTSQFRDAAERMGHDSVVANERGEPTVGVFSSSQLKSTIGNKGTFDPNNEDIGHAHGGAVRIAQGGQAMSEAIGGQVQTPVQGEMGKMTFDQYRTSIGMHEGGRHMAQGGQVQRFDEGGQASLDQMRYEFSNSPVMQATPRNPMQDFIGTVGGYMDRAGKFVSEAIEPTAEKHPVKHFLANILLADPLKGAGTALQDYTGTVRETDEDNPVRGVVSKNWKNLTTSREPMIDPRVLDVAQFAAPVVKGITKLGEAGAKAITPFAKSTAEMTAELYSSGKIPGMVAPGLYAISPEKAATRMQAKSIIDPQRMAFSGQTGVTTPIGSPKLEMIADQIVMTAKRLGVSIETARDMVMTGQARMGKKDGGKVSLDQMRHELTKAK